MKKGEMDTATESILIFFIMLGLAMIAINFFALFHDYKHPVCPFCCDNLRTKRDSKKNPVCEVHGCLAGLV